MKRCFSVDQHFFGKCFLTVLLFLFFVGMIAVSTYFTQNNIGATVFSFSAIEKKCFLFSDKGYRQFRFGGVVYVNVSVPSTCMNVEIETNICQESRNDVLSMLKSLYPLNSTTHGFFYDCQLQQVNFPALWIFTAICGCIFLFFSFLIIKELRAKRLEYTSIN